MNAETEMEKYIYQLKQHDWAFEWSDDHRVWRAGNESYKLIREWQKKLDPEFKVWNEHAPEQYHVKRPAENDDLQTV